MDNQPSSPDAETQPPEDPDQKREWYVLKVQSNREKSIKTSLERRIKREGMEEYFGEIVIPTQKVKESSKSGKPRVFDQKLFPGYMMIHMELNDETWYLVRDTTGVGDFTGAAGKPIAMRPEEVESMLRRDEDESKSETEPLTKIDFTLGDLVKIKEGGFEGFEGTVDVIDEANGRIVVLVDIFGRSTPVDLGYWQAERV